MAEQLNVIIVRTYREITIGKAQQLPVGVFFEICIKFSIYNKRTRVPYGYCLILLLMYHTHDYIIIEQSTKYRLRT